MKLDRSLKESGCKDTITTSQIRLDTYSRHVPHEQKEHVRSTSSLSLQPRQGDVLFDAAHLRQGATPRCTYLALAKDTYEITNHIISIKERLKT